MASGGTIFGPSFVLSLFRVRESELVLELAHHLRVGGGINILDIG